MLVGSNQPLGGSRIWARLLVALIAFGAICNIAQAGTLAKPFVAKNSPLGFGRNSVAICVGVEAIQALRTHQENAGFLGELASDDAYATRGGETGANIVYRSVNAAGKVDYVGITNNLARRAAEHLNTKGIQIEKLMGGLSRGDARAVEQALIEVHGLGRNGGTLVNRINSISPSNPSYAGQLQRGYELLKSVGYQ